MSRVSQYNWLEFAQLVHVESGHCLFTHNQPANRCYALVSGNLIATIEDPEFSRQATLPVNFEQEQLIAADAFINAGVYPYTVTAQSDCQVLVFDENDLAQIKDQPEQYADFLLQAMTSTAKQQQAIAEQAQAALLKSSAIPEVDFIAQNAFNAYQSIQSLPEEKIEAVIQDVAQAVFDQAENFAKLTVVESGMGVAENKQLKIQLGTLEVAKSLVGQPGLGERLQTSNSDGKNVDELAQSIGVVFAMIPVTNPVETLTFKFLSALKSRNSVIISSHRRAQNVGSQCVALIQSVLQQHGLDENLIQTPQMPPSRAITNAFMTHKNVHFILATGGPSMVHSAYCSGTPAIGVGKGNAPVWIAADANIQQAAQHVVASKSFDNGIVCGSENNLLVDAPIADEFLNAAQTEGAAVLDDAEVQQLLNTVFSSGALDSRWVGHSAAEICEFANIYRPYDVKLILAKVDAQAAISPLLKEKLAPVLSVSIMDNDQQALEKAKAILDDEGAGHTAIIHTQDKNRIQEYAKYVDVSRILVNTPGTQGCIGAANDLELSWTLGCGTQGGGSTSDNVTYKHLMNTKRIAYDESFLS